MSFRKNFVFFLTALIIFLIPFSWFPKGEVDLGGDSSRLYFLIPFSWKNISSYYVNSTNSIGNGNPAFYMLPFLFFLNIIYTLAFKNPHILNAAYSGFLLSGSFTLIYLILFELVNKKENINLRINFIFAGLFFALSPLLTLEWHLALYFISQVFVYPLIVYLFLKFLNKNRFEYLVVGVICSFIFSTNFNYSVAPWFFAFFPFSTILLLFYSFLQRKLKLFLYGFILFWSLFLPAQLFHILPEIQVITDSSSSVNNVIFNNSNTSNAALAYFHSIQPYVTLVYNFVGQLQYGVLDAYNNPAKEVIYKYNARLTPAYFIYIFIILSTTLIKNRKYDKTLQKIQLCVFLLFLILLFLMTANITSSLLHLFEKMLSLPGFGMFRHYIGKFNMSFMFFYSLLLGLSLTRVDALKRRFRILLYLTLFGLFTYSTIPFMKGDIANMKLTQTNNIRASVVMDDEYLNFLDSIKERKLDEKYLSLPLTNEAYQVLKGKNGGAYSGPSLASVLADKQDFNGLWTFSSLQKVIKPLLIQKDVAGFKNTLPYLNIGSILHNSDLYVYDNFPRYPYTGELKRMFPNQNYITMFIETLGFSKRTNINTFDLYTTDRNGSYLPHIYIPSETKLSGIRLTDLPSEFSKLDKKLTYLVVLKRQNLTKNLNMLASNSNSSGVVEMKKVNPTKYIVNIKKASSSFNLVLSDAYSNGWKLYVPDRIKENMKPSVTSLSSYKTIENNQFDQATKEELSFYLQKGLISSLGDLKEKKIKHVKWINGSESFSHEERYTIDFVSKNYKNTIQNDNLYTNPIYTQSIFDVPNIQHYVANGYANAWHINAKDICDKTRVCSVNKDGTYDIGFIIEYWPQRLFYIGAGISATTLVVCVGYLIYSIVREYRKKNVVTAS